MPGRATTFQDGVALDRAEAPVTFKAYLMTAFVAFGGILSGYDIGYTDGVMVVAYLVHGFTGLRYHESDATNAEKAHFIVPSSKKSLIISMLSAGTFLGSLVAGDLTDHLERRMAVLIGCGVYRLRVALQSAAVAYGMLIAG